MTHLSAPANLRGFIVAHVFASGKKPGAEHRIFTRCLILRDGKKSNTKQQRRSKPILNGLPFFKAVYNEAFSEQCTITGLLRIVASLRISFFSLPVLPFSFSPMNRTEKRF